MLNIDPEDVCTNLFDYVENADKEIEEMDETKKLINDDLKKSSNAGLSEAYEKLKSILNEQTSYPKDKNTFYLQRYEMKDGKWKWLCENHKGDGKLISK